MTALTLPIANYREGRTKKIFGQEVHDRFNGFHAGDDVEVDDTSAVVPVIAIADGTVVISRRVSGYGGVLVVRHTIGSGPDATVSALYGHLDLAQSPAVGASVRRGQQLATLGDHESKETDGERKHLHFQLWPDGDLKLGGYVGRPEELNAYLNPEEFFSRAGASVRPLARIIRYDATSAPHPSFAGLSFTLPEGWAIEYVAQIQALNLFTLGGEGTARERSQVFIRTFTADRFLTLNTVTIHATQDRQIKGHQARTYDIQKKPGIADFPHQPSWRNARHLVTDVRAKDSRSTFYVIAQRPGLSDGVYGQVISSLMIE